MERRKYLKNLDSAAVREARQALSDVHDCCESDVLLMNLLDSHDRMIKAIYDMRNNAELVIGLPERVFNLKDSIKIGNEILGDRL